MISGTTDKVYIVGEQWVWKIQEELSKSNAFLIIITPDSLASEWVKREIAAALHLNKTILGIVLRQTPLPPFLAIIQIISAQGLTITDVATTIAHNLGLKATEQAATILPSTLPQPPELRQPKVPIAAPSKQQIKLPVQDPNISLPPKADTHRDAVNKTHENASINLRHRFASVLSMLLVIALIVSTILFIHTRNQITYQSSQRNFTPTPTFTPTPPLPPAPSGFQIYTDPTGNYALYYPTNWADLSVAQKGVTTINFTSADQQSFALVASNGSEIPPSQYVTVIQAIMQSLGQSFSDVRVTTAPTALQAGANTWTRVTATLMFHNKLYSAAIYGTDHNSATTFFVELTPTASFGAANKADYEIMLLSFSFLK